MLARPHMHACAPCCCPAMRSRCLPAGLPAHRWVTAAAYLPGGVILSGGMDGQLWLWPLGGSAAAGWRVQQPAAHAGPVARVACLSRHEPAADAGAPAAGPALAASCSYDKSVKLWQLAGRRGGCKQLAVLQGHAAPVLEMQAAPGGQHILTGARCFCALRRALLWLRMLRIAPSGRPRSRLCCFRCSICPAALAAAAAPMLNARRRPQVRRHVLGRGCCPLLLGGSGGAQRPRHSARLAASRPAAAAVAWRRVRIDGWPGRLLAGMGRAGRQLHGATGAACRRCARRHRRAHQHTHRSACRAQRRRRCVAAQQLCAWCRLQVCAHVTCMQAAAPAGGWW